MFSYSNPSAGLLVRDTTWHDKATTNLSLVLVSSGARVVPPIFGMPPLTNRRKGVAAGSLRPAGTATVIAVALCVR